MTVLLGTIRRKYLLCGDHKRAMGRTLRRVPHLRVSGCAPSSIAILRSEHDWKGFRPVFRGGAAKVSTVSQRVALSYEHHAAITHKYLSRQIIGFS